jgi:hypothetical protein
MSLNITKSPLAKIDLTISKPIPCDAPVTINLNIFEKD